MIRYFSQTVFHNINSKDRNIAYVVFVSLVAFCVVFLHVFINVPLTFREVGVHTFYLALPAAFTCLFIECVGRWIFGRDEWHCNYNVWQIWLFVGGLATIFHSIIWHLTQSIPIVQIITQKHVDAGHPLCSFLQSMLLIAVVFGVLTEFLIRRSLQKDVDLLRRINEHFSTMRPMENNETQDANEKKICVKINGESRLISLSSTAYIQADENYCHLWQCEGEKNGELIRYTVRSTLKEFIEQLPDDHFMQTHRSYLVNPAYAKKIKKINDKFQILLFNDISVPVSRSRINLVMEKYPIMG
jgi:hypothetical protein